MHYYYCIGIDMTVHITEIFKQAISLDKAKTLSTERLLSYYKKYRYIQLRTISQTQYKEMDWFAGDVVSDEVYSCIKQYFDGIKTILAEREHIIKQ